MTVRCRTAAGLLRTDPHLGRWPHRGRVAAVGVGHSPTLRRWDGRPETTVGAWTVLAIRSALADAGVAPESVDCIVLCEDTSAGPGGSDHHPPAEFLASFVGTANERDGFSRLSAEWIVKNVPELKNVKLAVVAPECISFVLAAAIEAVGEGQATVCVAVKGWHNFPGRYGEGTASADLTVSGPKKWINGIAGPPVFRTAAQFQRYLHTYGKTHAMMAPFVVNSRANGLAMAEGYWAQHRPEPLTVEDYLASPWIAEPANLLDNDLPIHNASAYVITSADRARDLRHPPAYVLGHSTLGEAQGDQCLPIAWRSVVDTLEEVEANAAETARRIYASAAVGADDLTFENMYDGFTPLHVFFIEALGFAGISRGEALDLFQEDISVRSNHPVSPSGGNIGGGRTRCWGHTDSIQQIQGRAGGRAVRVPIRTAISGGPMTHFNSCIVWSPTPQ